MIVYIIPGKTKRIQESLNYISDEKKTAKDFVKDRTDLAQHSDLAKHLTYEEYRLIHTDGFQHALNYIQNENKIGGYISGYLCNPELAEEQFLQTKRKNLNRVGKTLKDDTGNYFYHIIQSFPKGIDISDEEVHNCGLELVKRLGLYQAVIASHVHPEIKEDEVLHGEQKHNHIIINSHIYHEFVDEDNPYKMKYHDCNDSYAQLQLINDQIAIEHGLPIISKTGADHFESWYEANTKSNGASWKERVRIDISNAMRVSYDFDSYEQSMLAAGYKLRLGSSKKEGQYITYTCPDGEKRIRDYKLGRGYTKVELETYWDIKNAIHHEHLKNNTPRQNRIERILEITSEPLFIEFQNELSENRKKRQHEYNLNTRTSYTNYLPLQTSSTRSHAELSYFDPDKTYNIVNINHCKMSEVPGQDILNYYWHIREQERLNQEEEKQRKKERQFRDYYSRSGYIKSTTREPYRIGKYDKNGRERSTAELILILAAIIIQNEFGKWQPPYTFEFDSQEYENDPIYASKDWKVQQMLDTIRVAREENITNPIEIDERLNLVGKEITKSEAEVRRLTDVLTNTKELIDAINGYHEVKELCDKIQNMSDSFEKKELLQLHTEELNQYKQCKATMYRFNVTSDNQIIDALERHDEYINKRKYAEAQNEKFKNQYTRLRKLKYNIQLAQNKQYCYGPAYTEPEETLEQKIQTAQNEKKHISGTGREDFER